MRDNCRGVDTFAPEKFAKTVCSVLQGLVGFNRDASVVFFTIMPPALIEVIKIEMRVTFCEFVRRTADIATVAELLPHGGIDLNRKLVSKNQMGCLECSGERRDDDVFDLKLIDFRSRVQSLRLPEQCDGRIEYHRIRLGRIVNGIECRLRMSNEVNRQFESFRLPGLGEVSLGY